MRYYRVQFKDATRLVKECDLSEAAQIHGEILGIGNACDVPDIFESKKSPEKIFINSPTYVEKPNPFYPYPYRNWITCTAGNGETLIHG